MTAKRLSLVLALVVVALDQLTKWWILDQLMRPPRLIELTPFFNLVMVWNRGVSFGLFNTDSSWNGYVLSAIALAIIVILLLWLRRVERGVIGAAIGLVIGGAIGNVIDRIRFGAVCDFLDLHAFGYHWPAFNIADSAISIGAAILVVDALTRPQETAPGR